MPCSPAAPALARAPGIGLRRSACMADLRRIVVSHGDVIAGEPQQVLLDFVESPA